MFFCTSYQSHYEISGHTENVLTNINLELEGSMIR